MRRRNGSTAVRFVKAATCRNARSWCCVADANACLWKAAARR